MVTNKINDCPCGSQIEYKSCCGVYHQGARVAPTPEALMRSRYTAYSLGNIAMGKHVSFLDYLSFFSLHVFYAADYYTPA